MPKRTGPNDGDARASRVIAQAQGFHANGGDPLATAFLRGMQAAEQACRDRVAQQYEAADRSAGEMRAAGNQRAAEAARCADHIQDLMIAAARACRIQPHRRGLRAMLARMVGTHA